MSTYQGHMTERLLRLTLEIIYLLTGQDYGPMKKSEELVKPNSDCHESVGWKRAKSTITEPPPHLEIHKRNNDKILDLTHKIIELLMGEVPIRCQDVAVYFSMEEWEYIEEHKDLYKDVMMEDHRPLTPPGKKDLYKDVMMEDHRNRTPPGKRDLYKDVLMEDHQNRTPPGKRDLYKDVLMEDHRNHTSSGKRDLYKDVMMEDHRNRTLPDGSGTGSLERCPNPLNPQGEKEENLVILHDYKSEDMCCIKAEGIDGEETYAESDRPFKVEQILETTCAGDEFNIGTLPEEHLLFPNYIKEEHDIPENSLNVITSDIHPFLHRKEILSDGIEPGVFPVPLPEEHLPFPNYIEEQHDIPENSSNVITSDIHPFLHRTEVLSHRIEPGDFPGAPDIFPCPECGKQFTSHSHLMQHQQTHTREIPILSSQRGNHKSDGLFSWPESDKRVKPKAYLMVHQKLHPGHNLKRIPCMSKLLQHNTIHGGKKKFLCKKCGKCFVTKDNLICHQETHIREKPFSCPECGKCFTRKMVLVRHLRIHNVENPFACLECGKRFTQKSDLERHTRTHTGEKPYTCSKCSKCFAQKSGLLRHQHIHRD
ncbi:uncharacterized protein LOC142663420 [Rhinoderma darwinii]|uniref:uncharacterized protein LOC142663420 n=1 Tax=Rhinoderma darwinii TaxID=43563 RepID=UPI003F6623DF